MSLDTIWGHLIIMTRIMKREDISPVPAYGYLLADGIWNEHKLPGDTPSSLNMWQKIQFGWVNPQVLDKTTTITDMPAAN